jgi:hypothetical protein
VFGSNTSPNRPEAPATAPPLMKWSMSRMRSSGTKPACLNAPARASSSRSGGEAGA